MTADGEPGLHYLCAGWYEFFTHIDHPVKTMVALREQRRPMSNVMAIMPKEQPDFKTQVETAARNSPCPCGSGRKTKHCHGGNRPINPTEPTTYPVFVAEPRPRVAGTTPTSDTTEPTLRRQSGNHVAATVAGRS